MSNITLSASVRSNLLSLQNTASLLDTTQTRLATGNKVNSALDNPTSYFTAQSLNARASDLGNLLDSVGNAIQTIQAANDGITSIQKLVDSAKATANQAQQLSETVEGTGNVAGLAGTAAIDVSGFTSGTAGNEEMIGDVTLTINGKSVAAITKDDTADTIVSKLQAAAATSKGSADEFDVTYSASTGVSIQAKNGDGTLTLTASATAGTSNGSGTAPTAAASIAAVQTALGLTVNGGSALGTLSSTATVVAAGTSRTDANVPNSARANLITQYNGLLDQIDQLTKDAGFNGNNLLAGSSTQLKVVFNETGTSNLTITGADTSAAGLGLNQLASTGFNTNAGITTILSNLKAASDTLRANASSFGSQLSIVQTRQDFTKALINTLQTGASNLTLADSNEEAANLLALQTRQSLSTKALSLASQSDQNVLRLLQ